MREHQANTRSISYREPGAKDWPAIQELSKRRGPVSAKEIEAIMRKHKRPAPSSPYEIARLLMLASGAAANAQGETRTRRPEEHRRRTVDPRKVTDWSKVPYAALPPLSHPDGEMARRRWLAAQRL